MVIRRGFVDVAAGQAHYRHAQPAPSTGTAPLVMVHASPGSAKMLETLITLFGATRPVFAIDTLGNGDSSPPLGVTRLSDRPALDIFVEGHKQAIDALGLDSFDLYGSHTGGSITCEIAIAWPSRVRHLILDGMSLYTDAERADMLARYAPGVAITADGGHLNAVWNFVRDTYLFWPWYRRDAHHLRQVGLPALEKLNDKVVEVLKAATTFHYSYNAAFAYRKEARLPLVTTPTLLACAQSDMLLPYLGQVAALMPGAQTLITPGATTETIERLCAFLDAPPSAAT
jgi:pimeloyl-ACP methyl ester carboxylesterase